MKGECHRCGGNSSMYFAILDQLDNQYKWCPACVYGLMKANKRYIEGEFKGDQDAHYGGEPWKDADLHGPASEHK